MDKESLTMETTGTMESRLRALQERGADGFEPVRFRHVTSLVRRSAKMRPSIRRKIEERAKYLLDALSKRLDAAQEAVRADMERIRSKDPESARKIHRLLEKGDFQALKKAVRTSSNHTDQGFLPGLIQELKKVGENASLDDNRLFLDHLLKDQEARIIGAFDDFIRKGSASGDWHPGRLRSFAVFRRTLARQGAKKIVADAVRNLPENPGHLNGQMISTCCLEAMEDLSPAYLERFIAFAHSLMCLEQVNGRQGKK